MKVLFALMMLVNTTVSEDYRTYFDEDYVRAENFIERNGTYFEMLSETFNTDQRFLKSIIFPELIRYSYFSDLFETGALEWLYVSGGSKAADFSIGHFQMKPSFVEALEGYVSSVEPLREEYGFIVLNGSGSSFRKIRMLRLKQFFWQMIYLACFTDAIAYRFASEKFASEEERLRFYCSAYNSGFLSDAQRIRERSVLRSFPYGPKFPDSQQFVYSDLAVDYFRALAVQHH